MMPNLEKSIKSIDSILKIRILVINYCRCTALCIIFGVYYHLLYYF